MVSSSPLPFKSPANDVSNSRLPLPILTQWLSRKTKKYSPSLIRILFSIWRVHINFMKAGVTEMLFHGGSPGSNKVWGNLFWCEIQLQEEHRYVLPKKNEPVQHCINIYYFVDFFIPNFTVDGQGFSEINNLIMNWTELSAMINVKG